MNTLQLPPLGATAPAAPPGKSPAVTEALSSPLKKQPAAAPKAPDSVAPDIGAGPDQQLAEARTGTVLTDERKAAVEKAQAEKAKAAKEAEAKRQAEEEAVTLDIGTLDRKIGLVEGTTKVFVDLVDPVHNKSVFRIFGPSEEAEKPAEPVTDETRPADANNAYSRVAGTPAHKDLGVA